MRFWLSIGSMTDTNQLAALRVENARLVALLDRHGIERRLPQELDSSRLSTHEKVALFRRLFRGRTDVYPLRWESKTSGKTGYAHACANEWHAGVCENLKRVGAFFGIFAWKCFSQHPIFGG